jgi:hypothetical protein
LLKKSEKNDEKFSVPLADVDQKFSVPLVDVDQKFSVPLADVDQTFHPRRGHESTSGSTGLPVFFLYTQR